jgi:uroporphyrinogen-III synthase
VIPIIVIRPQPGCDATVAAARAMGLDTQGYPLFEIAPRAWSPPPAEAFDALLIGSVNVLRHGGAGLSAFQGMLAYAVGQTTAEAARDTGFEVIATGQGGLQAMLAALRPGHRRLLRLAGEARVVLEPPLGVTITECVTYASEPRPMPPELAALLRDPAVVLLHSGEAARHFAHLCEGGDIDRGRIALAAIGPRVAELAGSGWRAVAAAGSPDDAALLALAREMCQTPAGPRNLQDRT